MKEDLIKFDESKIETELERGEFSFYNDKDYDNTASILFSFIVDNDHNTFRPCCKYLFNDNLWKYLIYYDNGACDWNISKDLQDKIKEEMAQQLCTYKETGCSDCEFNHATKFKCPLGID